MARTSVRIHDTLSARLKPLPLSEEDGKPLLRLYVCGITPYDSGHVGHAFTFASFDVLVRYLEATGTRVRYVQNITDVDDPLFERARRDGVRWDALAADEERLFLDDMKTLGWRAPDVMPKVSDEIPAILDAVERLQRGGYTYSTDALYFEAARYPGYGRLSRRSRRSMIAKLKDEGLLGRVGPDAKRDALDFPLWLPSAPDEPAWHSPFGEGRPGWHIECSAMSMRHLGEQVDLHGGGRDLVFSHHESERAQSESLTGCVPFARAWMHTGMVRFKRRKMSKSLGNLVVVKEAVRRASPAATRLYLVSHHYRRDWEWSWEGLERMTRLTQDLRELLSKDDAGGGGPRHPSAPLRDFHHALRQDLDTPRALKALRTAVTQGDAAGAGWMLQVLAGDALLDP